MSCKDILPPMRYFQLFVSLKSSSSFYAVKLTPGNLSLTLVAFLEMRKFSRSLFKTIVCKSFTLLQKRPKQNQKPRLSYFGRSILITFLLHHPITVIFDTEFFY